MTTVTPENQPSLLLPLPRIGAIAGLLFVFLLGVRSLGEGFQLVGADLIGSFFVATEDPFIGLVVGLLATSVVQSSSVTTSMIVGLVAAPESPLPLANAVPMIMGANIGTTVTATIVSLGHVGRREEFERAFPIALCHDMFNYLAVLVLLPLEIATGFLRRSAVWCAASLGSLGGVNYESPFHTLLSAAYAPIAAFAAAVFPAQGLQASFIGGLSALLIFASLFLLVRVMRTAAHSRVERFVTTALESSAIVAIAVGAFVTVMVQSSSITTSLLVPLGGAGLLRLEQAFPVTIGANIGTTVTALLAAMAVSGPNATAGLEIALVHLFFNLSGLLLLYPAKATRAVPLAGARAIAQLAIRSRKLTVAGIVFMFYGLPALCIAVSRMLD